MIGYADIQKALGVSIPVSQPMSQAILLWGNMYTNRSPWLTGDNQGLGLPAAVASEHARLVTIEAVYNISGGGLADFLSGQFDKVRAMMPVYTEFGVASGGGVLKPYVSGNGIAVDFVQAGDFFPVSFNSSGRMTSVIFPEYRRDGGLLYTRLECHQLKGNEYKIENRAFCSENLSVTVNNIMNLGGEIPLGRVEEWADLAPEVVIRGVDFPLFGYMKVPLANNIDPASPLGVSVYSRAASLVQNADEQYGGILWEYKSKETAVQAGAEFFDHDRYGNIIFPKGKERLFQAFKDTANEEKQLFNVFSPEIRDQSFFNGLNHMLQRIEFNCGLAYGTLSDPQNVDKTATEIKVSKQRSYDTVKSIQNAAETALNDLVRAMAFWAVYGGLAPDGEYSLTYNWDDSIIIDAETKRKHDLEDVAAGILAPWEYRVRNYGEDEETAKSRVPEMAKLIL